VIVTIDGPAGSGKSSTARAVARRLGFRHLDSGAFYRALTYAALRAGIAPDDWDALTADELTRFAIRAVPAAEGYRLCAGDEDVTDRIRSPEVNAHVSRMARVPAVRAWLLGRLRGAAECVDLVTDGRDMGTVVFPRADLKVFLTADPSVRARRRLLEQGVGEPSPADLALEVDRLAIRDRIDSEREVAPLRRPPDAFDVDTTGLTLEEQVAVIVDRVRQLRDAGEAGVSRDGG
jgi:cytidylate kinase